MSRKEELTELPEWAEASGQGDSAGAPTAKAHAAKQLEMRGQRPRRARTTSADDTFHHLSDRSHLAASPLPRDRW